MKSNKSKIRICVLGDICPHYVKDQFQTANAENVFHDILTLIGNADVTVANLEAPATDNNTKLAKNSVNLKARPEDIQILKSAGIQGLSLANNHILDYGTKGLEDTIASLNQNSLFYYGICNRDNKSSAYFVDIEGVKIGFLAFAEREFNCAVDYGFGAALWDDLESPQMIRETKTHCNYLIVQYHGGIEHYVYPSPYLQKKCRIMADSGADFVTCQHSHCVGSHEKWHNSEILYGQGNSVFGFRSKKSWNEGLIAEITISDNNIVNYFPVVAHTDGEYLAADAEAKKILDELENNSERITDFKFVQEQWMKFCKKQACEYFPYQFAWGRVANKLNRMSKGKLVALLTSKNSRRNAMNLIRCDAHREVITTILENEYRS